MHPCLIETNLHIGYAWDEFDTDIDSRVRVAIISSMRGLRNLGAQRTELLFNIQRPHRTPQKKNYLTTNRITHRKSWDEQHRTAKRTLF